MRVAGIWADQGVIDFGLLRHVPRLLDRVAFPTGALKNVEMFRSYPRATSACDAVAET